MNKVNHKKVLKDALNWVKETYLSEPKQLEPLHGICKAVEHYCCVVIKVNEYNLDKVNFLLRKLIESWPFCERYDFTDETGQLVKNTTFPVNGGFVWGTESNDGTIWENLKRLELLEYLIQEVNKDE